MGRTLLGAAALGLVASGAAGDLDAARAMLGVGFAAVDPDPDRAERYRDVAAAWRTAIDRCTTGLG